MAKCQDELYPLLPTDQKPESAYTVALNRLLPKGVIWGFLVKKLTNLFQDNVPGFGAEYQDNIPGQTEYQDNAPQPQDYTDTKFGNFISCFGSELYRFQTAWYELYTESIPGLSVKLLPDWERNAGVNNLNLTEVDEMSTEDRQCNVQRAIYSNHQLGMSKGFYIDYAESLGYVLEIQDIRTTTPPFVASPVGVYPVGNGSRVGNRLSNTKNVYVVFTVVSGDPAQGPTDRLTEILTSYKPAHVDITWVYDHQ